MKNKEKIKDWFLIAVGVSVLIIACGKVSDLNDEDSNGRRIVNGTLYGSTPNVKGIGAALYVTNSVRSTCSGVIACSTAKGTLAFSVGHCAPASFNPGEYFFSTETDVRKLTSCAASSKSPCAKITSAWQNPIVYQNGVSNTDNLLALNLDAADAKASGWNTQKFYPLVTDYNDLPSQNGVVEIHGTGCDPKSKTITGEGVLRSGKMAYWEKLMSGKDIIVTGDQLFGQMLHLKQNTKKQTTCSGDSGGPYITSKGVIGIHSRRNQADEAFGFPVSNNVNFMKGMMNEVCENVAPVTAIAKVSGALPETYMLKISSKGNTKSLTCSFTLTNAGATGLPCTTNMDFDPNIQGPTATLVAEVHRSNNADVSSQFTYAWSCQAAIDGQREASAFPPQTSTHQDVTFDLRGRGTTCEIRVGRIPSS